MLNDPRPTSIIPEAMLRPMFQPMNPPKLIGFDVLVDGKLVAVLTADTVRKALEAKHG